MTPTPSRLPPLLSVEAAADHLDVCSKTVRRLIEKGELHAHRIGRQLRISQDDLFLYIQKHRQ